MKSILLIFLLLFVGCSFFEAKKTESRIPASDPSGSNLAAPAPQISKKQILNYQKFRITLLAAQAKNMPQAIGLLSRSYGEYMKFYTLMYNSFSLHESSYENPRVIIFGPEARFVVTFNGNSQQRGGDSFEVMEYSDAKNEFQFREINFKTPTFNREDLNLTKQEIEFENENVVISKANPAKCQECHLATNGPTWNNSFIWPGTYGSAFNNLYLNFDRASRNSQETHWKTDRPISQGYQIALQEGVEDTEVNGMIRFLKGKPSHPRYKWLPPQISDAAFLKYANGTPFSELDLSAEYQAERNRLQAGPTWPSKPNQFFQQALMSLNNRRLIAAFKKIGIGEKAFARLPWNLLEDPRDGKTRTIDEMATRIQDFLSQAEFKKERPAFNQIVAFLKGQLRAEIDMQGERIANQRDNFGKDALIYAGDPRSAQRANMNWIGNSFEFYSSFRKDGKELNEMEKIAAATDTENQVMLSAVALLLKDRGMNLDDYVLTPRQFVLSFYRNGMTEAMKYLGYNPGDAL